MGRYLKMFLTEHSVTRKRNGSTLSGLSEWVNCLHVLAGFVILSYGASFPREPSDNGSPSTPETLPSPHDTGPTACIIPSHPPLVSSGTYRLALPRTRVMFTTPAVGRCGTFIGQCSQPLCSGDSAKHLDGPIAVNEYRQSRELDSLPGLQQAPELDPPSRLKRDASRTIFTWPLHRHRLPGDPGCVPPSTLLVCKQTSIAMDGVRAKISRRARTRLGRIKFHHTSFHRKTAPFMTKPTTPATHAKPEAPAKERNANRRVPSLALQA